MLHQFFDFIPIFLFLVAFKWYGIYFATLVGIVATAIQVGITIIWKNKIDKQQLITLIVFLIFGGMTLYFHNPLFVKWKPTVLFWLFSLVFLFSHFIGQKPVIQRMLEPALEKQANLPKKIWTHLSVAWITFFIILGGVNIFIAYHFSTATWVNFKVYGVMGLLIAFSFAQALYLSRFISNENK